MARKKFNLSDGIVFSTDPGFSIQGPKEIVQETLDPVKQQLKIKLDTKQRAGKAVTIVDGFIGKEIDLESLGKRIKTFCGTGGSVKDGLVIIQGDQREKVLQWLIKNEYLRSKKT